MQSRRGRSLQGNVVVERLVLPNGDARGSEPIVLGRQTCGSCPFAAQDRRVHERRIEAANGHVR